MKNKFSLFLLLFICSALPAQEKRNYDERMIDSLLLQLNKVKHDTDRVNLYSQLSYYYADVDPKKTFYYSIKAIELAKSNNFVRGEVEAYNHLGIYYDNKDDDDSAHYYFDKGIALAPKFKSNLQLSQLYHNKANLYSFNGHYEEALTLYLKALKMREQRGKPGEMSSSYTNIGAVYLSLKRYEEAKNYFRKAISLDTHLDDTKGLSMCLNNMGNIHREQGNYDSALYFYEESLELKVEMKDKRGMANAYTNLCGLYCDTKNFNKSISYGLSALKIYSEMNNRSGTAYASANLGAAFKETGQFEEAYRYLNTAVAISNEVHNDELKQELYELLAETYAKHKNYAKAYEYHQKYASLKDSLLNVENSLQINEMSTKYETEKKDKELIKKDAEIKIQEADSKQKSLQRNGFVIGFGLMILLTLFVFRSYRQKQKANEIITGQKKEVEKQKEIIQEKNKEIVDSINYALRIQQAVLPREEEFKQVSADHFVLFKPKDIVSGDYYWVSTIEGYTFFTAADCTGHGVPGGFMSMLGMSLLNEVINEKKILDPADVLDMMRIKLITSLKQKGMSGENKDGMDMVLCRLNQERSELLYAAANNPLWLIRNGKCLEFAADKQPVGISTENNGQFTQHSIPLLKGDCIYIFTDGFADQFGGPKGKKFKYKPFKEMLIENHSKPMNEQKQLLSQVMKKWQGDLEQVDDVLVIGVRI